MKSNVYQVRNRGSQLEFWIVLLVSFSVVNVSSIDSIINESMLFLFV
jgi:hypothetical protein